MYKKMIESHIIDFLSIKYDCNKEVFSKEGLNIIKNKTNNIKMLLYKNLILVSTREDKYEIVCNSLKNKSTYEIFEFPYVYGQSIYYVPNMEKKSEIEENNNFEFKLFDGNTKETNLSEGFENALTYKDGVCISPIAYCAYDNDKIIGVAGADEIDDNIWEVGIEVLPEYRNQGLATILTKKLTEKILEKGILPIWCASVSNIGSQRVAAICDYIPVFMETFGDIFEDNYVYKDIEGIINIEG